MSPRENRDPAEGRVPVPMRDEGPSTDGYPVVARIESISHMTSREVVLLGYVLHEVDRMDRAGGDLATCGTVAAALSPLTTLWDNHEITPAWHRVVVQAVADCADRAGLVRSDGVPWTLTLTDYGRRVVSGEAGGFMR